MSDRLSPILVKELRQGLRARVFEGAFLLLQVLMLFAVIMAVTAASVGNRHLPVSLGEGVFWGMLAIPVLLIMPMRGATALRSEIDGKSLELIFLTRLSAWRIVAGKWGALFSQTCLLVVSVLPYAVLRYYLGRVNLLGDLASIAVLLGLSALFTALTVSLSAFPSRVARGMTIFFPVALMMFGPGLVVPVAVSARGFGGGFPPMGWKVGLAALFYGLAVLGYLLEIGAARIAPPAENHALRKRLIGLLVLVSGPIAVGLGADKGFLWLPLILVTPICVNALAETWRPVPGACRPLLRWGRLGRGAAPALLPGWPSGFVYTLAVIVLCLPMLALTGNLSATGPRVAFLAWAGALLMPVAVIRLFLPRVRQVGAVYFVIQLLLLIGTLLAMVFDELFNLGMRDVLSIVPLSALILAVAGEADASWAIPAASMLAIIVLGVIARSGAQWQELRRVVEAGRGLAGTGAEAGGDAG